MADNDKEVYEEGTFMDRIKESPRTVSALIIILIVAAAIYAFSGNQPEGGEGQTDQVAVTTEEAEEGEAVESPTSTDNQQQPTTSPASTPTPVSREQIAQQARTLPESRRTDTAYVEVAQAGDGTTHLARRATTRWLSENDAGYSVTNEHRIYIEDYLQKKLGSKQLSLGEEHTITFDMMKEAVEAARNLNDSQLRNLSQYTHALT